MPQPILVDTSAWIDALRPDGEERVRREVRLAVACALHHGASLLHRDAHLDQIRELLGRKG